MPEYQDQSNSPEPNMPPFPRLSDAQVLGFARKYFDPNIKLALTRDPKAKAVIGRAYESIRLRTAQESTREELLGELFQRATELSEQSPPVNPYDLR
jgi:hypothetical protein